MHVPAKINANTENCADVPYAQCTVHQQRYVYPQRYYVQQNCFDFPSILFLERTTQPQQMRSRGTLMVELLVPIDLDHCASYVIGEKPLLLSHSMSSRTTTTTEMSVPKHWHLYCKSSDGRSSAHAHNTHTQAQMQITLQPVQQVKY